MQATNQGYRSIQNLYHERDNVAVSKPYSPHQHGYSYSQEGAAARPGPGRRSLMDAVDADREPQWYWRLIAMTSVWMILGGYLIFPSIFDVTNHEYLRFSNVAVSVIVAALLTGGYALSGLLWFAVRSPVFRLEYIATPISTSSAFAFLATAYSLAASTRYDSTGVVCAVCLAMSALSASLYGALAFYITRRLRRITVPTLLQLQPHTPQPYNPSPYPDPPRSSLNHSLHESIAPSLHDSSFQNGPVHDPKYYQNYVANVHPEFAAQQQQQQQQYSYPAQTAIPTSPLPPPAPVEEQDLIGQNLHGLLHRAEQPTPRGSGAAASTFRLEWPVGNGAEDEEIDPLTGQKRAPTLMMGAEENNASKKKKGDKKEGQGHDRHRSGGGGSAGIVGKVKRLGDRGRSESRGEDGGEGMPGHERKKSRDERRREIEMGELP